ncbi:uncharacterized protein [Palaemon carinicauda]|uniref:uncharacterized protein n=1 Tax=Palaemon carinicauda TaxID=392227 RepID=UPI0035B6169D
MDFQLCEFLIPRETEAPTLSIEGIGSNITTEGDDVEYVINLINGLEDVPPGSVDAVKVTVEDSYMYPENELSIKDLITMNPADVNLLAPPAYETTIGSPYSPCSSETSTSSYDNLNSLLNGSVPSPTASEEIISQMVSPANVSSAGKRKRGRKPKSDSGANLPKAKKPKVYEIDQPFEDKEMERKRLNAVNAKRHRDMQKEAREKAEMQLLVVKNERDMLKKQVEELQRSEALLKKQMLVFKEKMFSLWKDVEKVSLPL